MDVREKLVELLGRCAVEESITIEPVAENRLVDFIANHGVGCRSGFRLRKNCRRLADMWSA